MTGGSSLRSLHDVGNGITQRDGGARLGQIRQCFRGLVGESLAATSSILQSAAFLHDAYHTGDQLIVGLRCGEQSIDAARPAGSCRAGRE